MLVEINLLPQKERGKKSLVIMLISVLAVFLLLGGYYYWQIQLVKNDIAAVDRQVSMTKKIAEAEGKNAEKDESSMSVTLLKSAVEWANNYPIQTIPVMQHLTALLPERGFIQSFGYTEGGTVTISVQFDSSREAAYFLDSLNKSEWINEASLSSLTAQESKETKENVTTNTGTVQTENGQTTTTKNNVVVTTDPNNPNSITITTIDPNETGTTKTETEKTVTEPTNKFVPRYLGQFEIKFNKETIKKQLNKEDDGEEGVTAS